MSFMSKKLVKVFDSCKQLFQKKAKRFFRFSAFYACQSFVGRQLNVPIDFN